MMICLGARVILACRSEQRADEARTDIMAVTGNKNVEVRKLDLASLQSVRDFAQKFNQGKLAHGTLSLVEKGSSNPIYLDCLHIYMTQHIRKIFDFCLPIVQQFVCAHI